MSTASPAPKSAFASRKSRWPTEPEARPAAGWSKAFLRRCFSGALPDRWAMPPTSHINGAPVAITTDSFVVKPLSFPGGSIGELAVNGTVNDLAVSGARAEAWSSPLCSKPDLPTRILEAEVRAMAKAARRARASRIAGGDTKVVEHGKADQMYITTTGIGRLIHGVTSMPRSVRVRATRFCFPGPSAITASRSFWRAASSIFEADLRSDTRSVLPLVEALAQCRRPGHSLDARSHARRRRHLAE